MSFEGLRQSLTLPTTKQFAPHYYVPVEVSQLERQRERCRHAKDYKTAQQLDNRLNELKQVHEEQLLQELDGNQAAELSTSDASFEQAKQQLLQEWNIRTFELHGQLQQAEQQLLARQEAETAALLAAQAAVQPRPKFSPALLNMRHIERTLAFQKEFVKADKVKQQADQQALLELSQMGTDRAGKQEAERAHLAARHMKEQEAAAKKAASALLAAQQRQDYELEQLTRRHQAIKLSLSRAHAAQRLALQQSLRGTLGLAKPSQLLGLPSFNSSLAETRSLVPSSPVKGFEAPLPPQPCSAERCRSPVGASGLYGSPGFAPPSTAGRAGGLEGRVSCQPNCSHPGSPGGGNWMCHCAAATDAAAAAAGYGLSMPPLTASGGSRIVARSSSNSRKPGTSSSSPIRPYTRAGWSRSLGAPGSRGVGSGSIGAQHGSVLSRDSSGLPAAVRAAHLPVSSGIPADRAAVGISTCALGPDSVSDSDNKVVSSSGGSSSRFEERLGPGTSHTKEKPAVVAAAGSPTGSTTSSGCLSPWSGPPTVDRAITSLPRSRFRSMQEHPAVLEHGLGDSTNSTANTAAELASASATPSACLVAKAENTLAAVHEVSAHKQQALQQQQQSPPQQDKHQQVPAVLALADLLAAQASPGAQGSEPVGIPKQPPAVQQHGTGDVGPYVGCVAPEAAAEDAAFDAATAPAKSEQLLKDIPQPVAADDPEAADGRSCRYSDSDFENAGPAEREAGVESGVKSGSEPKLAAGPGTSTDAEQIGPANASGVVALSINTGHAEASWQQGPSSVAANEMSSSCADADAVQSPVYPQPPNHEVVEFGAPLLAPPSTDAEA